MTRTTYAIALGSNRSGRAGRPEAMVAAAAARLGAHHVSPIIRTPPLGPSIRRFANAAALVDSDLAPPAMLAWLKAIERDLGRRRGRRWGARPIDLDIILWSGGTWRARDLTIPHGAFRSRDFVLVPLAAVAGRWRDPLTHRHIRQLRTMVDRRRPCP
ncbi:2-amino-4-hydroxy-6-hydroxymethyldihydropteridine diphosphokinase [Sphingomonas sp. S-NIH.Pt15_0812]|jgi:2-amino-4-hydroxy-6-hydroxymethyldihydropteridine diphosphokinase|uniref:2-amino-4-hydroxy-6- hydroxymethyldihydropteridine diphosphokinase n=1 Tax=Sphingomonas sp. S-NIH.Pt15_0812 TaxID=1920129 RepID=UPI000F7EF8AA|nr:2-amino-4-hydroxy-6-hydroxymethyldihydropteridine diphosphokinase [Sphingomonas sp. S-NIH.Pt15_0812]RSU46224.1 2-amino-4-hydroxy-6-hydroxymethyldihydropteridine diphosphokinase [Sphingomonas sp. S-NIH.Pt15_0812]